MVIVVADRDIPEEMVEKAARAAFDAMKTGVFANWPFDDLEVHHQEHWRAAARSTLSAALAGRQVVDLPVLDADSDAIDGGADYTIGALVRSADGTPRVHFDAADDTEQACLSWSADLAERVGLALVAVARRAKQMAAEGVAAGSGSGEG